MYAECVEKPAGNTWSSRPRNKDWQPLKATVQLAVAAEQWCTLRPWTSVPKRSSRRESSVSPALRREFEGLVAKWESDTAFRSSDTEIVLHPAYQRIIGMGERVLPLIFQSLNDHGGNWFWALRHITGDNPVSKDNVGKSRKMKEAWIQWGRERHYI